VEYPEVIVFEKTGGYNLLVVFFLEISQNILIGSHLAEILKSF